MQFTNNENYENNNEFEDEYDEEDSVLMSMAEVEKETVEWLWYPYIPYGKITIIQGNPGDGKTNLALKIAACVSSGTPLPGLPKLEQQKVIYLSAEDGVRDTLKPRLEELGADTKNILFFKEEDKPTSLSQRMIEIALDMSGAKVLIIDPIQAFMGSRTDMNKANEVRETLRPVGELAEKYKCSIILIGHLNKAQGLNSIYRGIGSMDFTAISRSILLVGRRVAVCGVTFHDGAIHLEYQVLHQFRLQVVRVATLSSTHLNGHASLSGNTQGFIDSHQRLRTDFSCQIHL